MNKTYKVFVNIELSSALIPGSLLVACKEIEVFTVSLILFIWVKNIPFKGLKNKHIGLVLVYTKYEMKMTFITEVMANVKT